MSSKFFNNNGENTLFAKLKGIAQGMANFDRFLAVVGFFRSSGYFKLRKELGTVSEIKILVGINVDELFRRHKRGFLRRSWRLNSHASALINRKMAMAKNNCLIVLCIKMFCMFVSVWT